MRSMRLAIGENNGKEEGDSFPEDWYNTLNDSTDTDTKMSVEKFDYLKATILLAATAIIITLGFLFKF